MNNFWQNGHERNINEDKFRGHEQYLGQHGYPHRAVVDYLKSVGLADWISKLSEDDAFDNPVEIVDGLTVSRDLLDSILEIDFMLRAGGLPCGTILDIGAGYGRLAYRITQSFESTSVYCVDAISISQRVCAKYLAYRGATRAFVGERPVHADLAINVFSWGECALDEVRGWLDVLEEMQVPRLFHIPHTLSFGSNSSERGSGNGESYRPDLESRGWKLAKQWIGPECDQHIYTLWEKQV